MRLSVLCLNDNKENYYLLFIILVIIIECVEQQKILYEMAKIAVRHIILIKSHTKYYKMTT